MSLIFFSEKILAHDLGFTSGDYVSDYFFITLLREFVDICF